MISDKLKRIVKIILLVLEMVVILIAAISTIAWLIDPSDIIYKSTVILVLWILVFKVHDLKK